MLTTLLGLSSTNGSGQGNGRRFVTSGYVNTGIVAPVV